MNHQNNVERVDFDTEKPAWGELDGLDDLAISGDLISLVRLERMSSGNFWGCIYMRDGRSLRLTFNARKGRLNAGAEWE